MAQYLVHGGLDYPTPDPDAPGEVINRRAEPGDVVDDLPEQSIPWLLAGNHIEVHAPDAEVAQLAADAAAEPEATAPIELDEHEDEAGE